MVRNVYPAAYASTSHPALRARTSCSPTSCASATADWSPAEWTLCLPVPAEKGTAAAQAAAAARGEGCRLRFHVGIGGGVLGDDGL